MPGLVAEDKLTLGGGEHVRRDVALQLGSLQETINVSISDREAPPPPPPPAPSGRLAPPAPPPPPPRQSVSQPDVDPCSQSPSVDASGRRPR
ncbi:MAG: hypothetical protein DMF94_14865 [Acidobacteria bacterium]|nr:MAG: hypothetical protein DMF94_14865 [Acidobacteriota bacterium]